MRDGITTLHEAIAPAFEGLETVLYTGTFWSGSEQEIIGYGAQVMTRPNGSEVDWFIMGLAQQKNYISLYVNAVEDGKYLSEARGKQLGNVKVGKASISFPRADVVDLAELSDLAATARRIGI